MKALEIRLMDFCLRSAKQMSLLDNDKTIVEDKRYSHITSWSYDLFSFSSAIWITLMLQKITELK